MKPLIFITESENDFFNFACGTVKGLIRISKEFIEVTAIQNTTKHNGDFNDTIKQLERLARKSGKSLKIIELYNNRLIKHLLIKRDYKHYEQLAVKKSFNNYTNVY